MPVRADRQGIGWSIPLMNSNIYYFVLELSIQGRQAARKPVSGFFNYYALKHTIRAAAYRANSNGIGTVWPPLRAAFISSSYSPSCG